ncbi:MAG TPA: hypothetical protein ENI27_09115 [bacterium]|nr:hypothetical protein [bacterium]
MKQYKIIIDLKADENGDLIWEFEGPQGPFTIPYSLLSLKRIRLEQLLVKCGFVVEWREK